MVPFRAANDPPLKFHRHAVSRDIQPNQEFRQSLAFRHAANLSVYNNLYLFCSNVSHALSWRNRETENQKLASEGRISL